MIRTGEQFRDSIRDGREVWVNGERVREFVKPLQDNEVPVYVDGQLVRIQINGDETLARQLRPLDQGTMNPILEFMRGANRYLSKIYTGYNPAFIIRNTAREPASPSDSWVKSARMWRHEPGQDREYPVKHELAEWLIRQLCDRDFDIAAMDGIEPGKFEGHAFQFVHRRLLKDHELPVIPVILNTFDPPNQPTPRRCVALGAALRELIAAWPEDLRVGVIASGGLSHFVVDEALDLQLLGAIRNWLVVGELARELDLEWVEYVPGYRTPALTGTGLAFAAWKPLP